MIDIPAELYSEYSGELFDTCIDCGTELLDGKTPYVILKHIVDRETVFEMAICLPCTVNLQQEYSAESKGAIRAWFAERARTMATGCDASDSQPHGTAPGTSDDAQDDESAAESLDLDHCQLCRIPRSQTKRYIVEAVCVGRRLIQANEPSLVLSFPLLVCERCTEGLSHLISEKTRDQWNRFVEDHFDGPPEIEVDPSNRDLMLV